MLPRNDTAIIAWRGSQQQIYGFVSVQFECSDFMQVLMVCPAIERVALMTLLLAFWPMVRIHVLLRLRTYALAILTHIWVFFCVCLILSFRVLLTHVFKLNVWHERGGMCIMAPKWSCERTVFILKYLRKGLARFTHLGYDSKLNMSLDIILAYNLCKESKQKSVFASFCFF